MADSTEPTGQQYPHKDLTERIIGAAFTVSNALGCGFLEKVYENALRIELQRMRLKAATQMPVQIQYRGETVGEYVSDLIVEDTILVEIKATIEHHDVYKAQAINYLHATGLPVGLLLNFGQPKVKVHRFVLMNRKINDVPGTVRKEFRSIEDPEP